MDMRLRFPLENGLAYMDIRGGHAIICDAAGERFTYGVDANVLAPGNGVHVGMYLQPGMVQITTMPAGDHPFTAVREFLASEHGKARARYLFTTLIDPEVDLGLRHGVARVLQEELLVNEAILTDLRTVVLEIPLPEDASIPDDLPQGNLADLLREVQQKWRPGQSE